MFERALARGVVDLCTIATKTFRTKCSSVTLVATRRSLAYLVRHVDVIGGAIIGGVIMSLTLLARFEALIDTVLGKEHVDPGEVLSTTSRDFVLLMSDKVPAVRKNDKESCGPT